MFSVNIALPAESLDFSDLDVRDELNRPVKDSTVVRAFASSVQAVLLKTLVENLTPNNRFIKNILSLKHDVVCGWIKCGIQETTERIHAVISSIKKLHVYLVGSKIISSVSVVAQKAIFSHNNFSFLISSLLSSTQILR